MGMKIVQGRPFLETDRAGSPPVMIVNEAAARKYFPQGKALGHRGHRGGVTSPWSEVVGVVANVRHWGWTWNRDRSSTTATSSSQPGR
jgi:hypothetical protein